MLPQDEAILLSFLNTKLRDEYDSLEALCDDLREDPEKIAEKMAALGYVYDRENNRFAVK